MNRRSFFARAAGALAALGLMPKRAEAEVVEQRSQPDPRGPKLTCWHANPWTQEEAERPYSVPRFFDERCPQCVDEAQWHGLNVDPKYIRPVWHTTP